MAERKKAGTKNGVEAPKSATTVSSNDKEDLKTFRVNPIQDRRPDPSAKRNVASKGAGLRRAENELCSLTNVSLNKITTTAAKHMKKMYNM
jgi:hypothetical protein